MLIVKTETLGKRDLSQLCMGVVDCHELILDKLILFYLLLECWNFKVGVFYYLLFHFILFAFTFWLLSDKEL